MDEPLRLRRKELLLLFEGLSPPQARLLGREMGDIMDVDLYHEFSRGLTEASNDGKSKSKCGLMLHFIIYVLITVTVMIISNYFYKTDHKWVADGFFGASISLFAVCISELFQLATCNPEKKWVRMLIDVVVCMVAIGVYSIWVMSEDAAKIAIDLSIAFGVALLSSSYWAYINSAYTLK